MPRKLTNLKVKDGRLVSEFMFRIKQGKCVSYIIVECVSRDAAFYVIRHLLNPIGLSLYRYLPSGSSCPTDGNPDNKYLSGIVLGCAVTVCLRNWTEGKEINYLKSGIFLEPCNFSRLFITPLWSKIGVFE